MKSERTNSVTYNVRCENVDDKLLLKRINSSFEYSQNVETETNWLD